MTTVYLNGDFIPAEQAKISPMDRGFLFGDGIYEVIPSYNGRCVGFTPHIERMQNGLGLLSIDAKLTIKDWQQITTKLIADNRAELGDNLGVYLHVSRGTDTKRGHAFPTNVTPTVFGFAFAIPPEPIADKAKATSYHVVTGQDLRWQRCNIKSTSLLGNVLHYQQGADQGAQEILLFDQQDNLTEGASVNVFIIKDGVIATPPLSNKLLPGITRQILLAILAKHTDIEVQQREISQAEVLAADEIWLTSSSKEVAPVLTVNNQPVGTGHVGDLWLVAQQLFSAHKFDY